MHNTNNESTALVKKETSLPSLLKRGTKGELLTPVSFRGNEVIEKSLNDEKDPSRSAVAEVRDDTVVKVNDVTEDKEVRENLMGIRKLKHQEKELLSHIPQERFSIEDALDKYPNSSELYSYVVYLLSPEISKKVNKFFKKDKYGEDLSIHYSDDRYRGS
jgi:hypothetical protein